MIGRWGDNIKDVVTHPWQFEPWMTRSREMQRLSPQDPRYRSAARIAHSVLAGETPTHAGATHFLESDDRSQAARRVSAGLGAWQGAADRPAYVLYARRGQRRPDAGLPLLEWHAEFDQRLVGAVLGSRGAEPREEPACP